MADELKPIEVTQAVPREPTAEMAHAGALIMANGSKAVWRAMYDAAPITRPTPSLPDIEGLVGRAKYAMERTAALEYGPSDLIRELLDAIDSLASSNEARRVALGETTAFIGVMFGQGADAIIPETITTPLGVPIKIGAIMRDARKAYLGEEGK